MVRLVTGEVKTCRLASSLKPMMSIMTWSTKLRWPTDLNKKRALLRMLKKYGQRSVRRESSTGAMNQSSIVPWNTFRLSDSWSRDENAATRAGSVGLLPFQWPPITARPILPTTLN